MMQMYNEEWNRLHPPTTTTETTQTQTMSEHPSTPSRVKP